MRSLFYRGAMLFRCALLVGVLSALTYPVLAAEATSTTRLKGPAIAKLDWNIRALRAADLDRDGKQEIILINNDRGRIDILNHEAWDETSDDPEAGMFRLTTAARCFDLAIGDLNGDELPDIVYTAEPGGLIARLQQSDGNFGPGIKAPLADPVGWYGAIGLLPKVGASGVDVTLISEDGLRWYSLNENADAWTERALLPLGQGDAYGIRVVDLNNDGLEDIFYCVTDSQEAMRIRLRRQDGGFGPEQAVRLPSPITTIDPFLMPDGETLIFGWLEVGSYAFKATVLKQNTTSDQPTHERYRSPVRSEAFGAWATADLDQDGRKEWYLADPDGARIWRYYPRDDGTLDAPKSFPAFSGVEHLATGDVDGDGVPDLIVSSPKEKAIGIARWSKEGRLLYPDPLPTDSRPDAMTVGDFNQDGRADIAYARQNKGQREIIPLFSPKSGDWVAGEPIILSDLKTNINALISKDIDQDGRDEILVFAPKNPLRLVKIENQTGKELKPTDSAVNQSGLVDGLKPSQLSFADLDGDGKTEWLLASKGRVRILNWSSTKGFEVRDQLNSAAKDDVKAVLPAKASSDSDAPLDLWLVVGNDGIWEKHSLDKNSVWRFKERHETHPVEPIASFSMNDGAWIAGERLLERVRFGGTRWELLSPIAFEQDLEDVRPLRLALGDWNQDRKPEVALVDALETHILQIVSLELTEDSEGKRAGRSKQRSLAASASVSAFSDADADAFWARKMHFRVFEQDPSYTGPTGSNREPREVLWSDLNGDGLDDLLLLVHDRVLIYEAKPEPSP